MVRPLHLAAAVAAGFAPVAAAAHPLLAAATVVPGVPTPETEIRSVLGFWDRARAQHDVRVLDRLLAPEFAAITAAGAPLGRAALLAGGAPERGARMIEREGLAVAIDGDRATATSRLVRIGTPRGAETAEVTRETLTLRREGETWLIVRSVSEGTVR
ncbi:MAG TPA: nuclear transport factor 2 family protein [Allosphingosinicella sp.]